MGTHWHSHYQQQLAILKMRRYISLSYPTTRNEPHAWAQRQWYRFSHHSIRCNNEDCNQLRCPTKRGHSHNEVSQKENGESIFPHKGITSHYLIKKRGAFDVQLLIAFIFFLTHKLSLKGYRKGWWPWLALWSLCDQKSKEEGDLSLHAPLWFFNFEPQKSIIS